MTCIGLFQTKQNWFGVTNINHYKRWEWVFSLSDVFLSQKLFGAISQNKMLLILQESFLSEMGFNNITQIHNNLEDLHHCSLLPGQS